MNRISQTRQIIVLTAAATIVSACGSSTNNQCHELATQITLCAKEQRATLSLDESLCASTIDPKSSACKAAFNTFVDCIQNNSCANLDANCSATEDAFNSECATNEQHKTDTEKVLISACKFQFFLLKILGTQKIYNLVSILPKLCLNFEKRYKLTCPKHPLAVQTKSSGACCLAAVALWLY